MSDVSTDELIGKIVDFVCETGTVAEMVLLIDVLGTHGSHKFDEYIRKLEKELSEYHQSVGLE